MKVLLSVNPALRRIFRRPARTCPGHRAGTAVLWSWRSGKNFRKKKIQLIPSSAFSNNSLQAARSVSAPSSATGQLRETSADLVWTWTNPSMLNSSSTISTVPRAGCTQLGLKHALRVLTKKNRGPMQTIFARRVEAVLLRLHLMPQLKLLWSLLTWWPRQGSIGWGPSR